MLDYPDPRSTNLGKAFPTMVHRLEDVKSICKIVLDKGNNGDYDFKEAIIQIKHAYDKELFDLQFNFINVAGSINIDVLWRCVFNMCIVNTRIIFTMQYK